MEIICAPALYFAISPKVTECIESEETGGRKQSPGELGVSPSSFCGQHITVEIPGVPWLSQGKGLSSMSPCVPFPRLRVGTKFFSRAIITLRLFEALKDYLSASFFSLSPQPRGSQKFNLVF